MKLDASESSNTRKINEASDQGNSLQINGPLHFISHWPFP